MTVKRIRPVGHATVPYPTPPYAMIPFDGCLVEWPGPSSYWVRRLREGAIRIVPDVQDAPPKDKDKGKDKAPAVKSDEKE
jgi:hypothetical protein